MLLPPWHCDRACSWASPCPSKNKQTKKLKLKKMSWRSELVRAVGSALLGRLCCSFPPRRAGFGLALRTGAARSRSPLRPRPRCCVPFPVRSPRGAGAPSAVRTRSVRGRRSAPPLRGRPRAVRGARSRSGRADGDEGKAQMASRGRLVETWSC